MQQQTQHQLIEGLTGIVDRLDTMDSELMVRGIETRIARDLVDQGVSLLSIINTVHEVSELHLVAYSLYIQTTNNLILSTINIYDIEPKINFVNCDDTCSECGGSLLVKHEDIGEVGYCVKCGATYTT